MPDASGTSPLTIPHSKIFPSPLNDRTIYDAAALAELALSIEQQGILQPLLVRPRVGVKPDEFEIIAGERRWRAVELNIKGKKAKADVAVPVTVRDASDSEAVEMAVIENLQREDLTPIEEAHAFKRLIGLGHGTDDIAKRVGSSRRFVQLRLDLIERLAPAAQTALAKGELNIEQARELTRAPIQSQEAVLEDLKDGYLRDSEELRDELFGELPSVDAAFFPLDQYTGEFVTEPEAKGKTPKLFADKAQFLKLQNAAVKAKAKELETTWTWVKICKSSALQLPWDYKKATKKNHPKAGAVIVRTGDHKIAVHTNVIDTSEKPTAAAAKKEGPPEYTDEFLSEVAAIKKEAVEIAVMRSPEIAARIALMALALNLDTYEADAAHPKTVEALDVVKTLQGNPGAQFRKLGEMRGPQAARLMGAAAAAVIGHADNYARHGIGDDDLLIAVARTAKADVADVFEFYGDCGNEFLDACGPKQIERIALDLDIVNKAADATGALVDGTEALTGYLRSHMAEHRKYMPPWLFIGTEKEIKALLAKAPKLAKPKAAAKPKTAPKKKAAKKSKR